MDIKKDAHSEDVAELIGEMVPQLVQRDLSVSTSALAYCLACNIAFGIRQNGLDMETVVDGALEMVRQQVVERLSSMEATGGKRHGQSVH